MKRKNLATRSFKFVMTNYTIRLTSVLLLGIGGIFISACTMPSASTKDDQKKPTLSIETLQVDQRAKLGNKIPDGQYLVTKVLMKNLSNDSLNLDPNGFQLQNITDNEKDRYSQPSEKSLSFAFVTDYSSSLRDKLVDTAPVKAYPRLQLERYFVFMVPEDAKPDQYRIFYKPLNINTPLVSGKTLIHDYRYNNVSPSP